MPRAVVTYDGNNHTNRKKSAYGGAHGSITNTGASQETVAPPPCIHTWGASNMQGASWVLLISSHQAHQQYTQMGGLRCTHAPPFSRHDHHPIMIDHHDPLSPLDLRTASAAVGVAAVDSPTDPLTDPPGASSAVASPPVLPPTPAPTPASGSTSGMLTWDPPPSTCPPGLHEVHRRSPDEPRGGGGPLGVSGGVESNSRSLAVRNTSSNGNSPRLFLRLSCCGSALLALLVVRLMCG